MTLLLRDPFDAEKHRALVENSFVVAEPRKALARGPIRQGLDRLATLEYRRRKRAHYIASRHVVEKELPRVHAAQLALRADGGLVGDYQWHRLGELHSFLARAQPSGILEFGSGGSTVLFAHYGAGARPIRTLDASKHWLERTRNASELCRHVDLRHAEVTVEARDGECVSSFAAPHDEPFDMVYVDGPYAHPSNIDPSDPRREVMEKLPKRDPTGHVPNIDAELMWDAGVYPRWIVVDGRRATVRRLIERMNGRYRVFLPSDILFRSGVAVFPPQYRYHTYFVRKD